MDKELKDDLMAYIVSIPTVFVNLLFIMVVMFFENRGDNLLFSIIFAVLFGSCFTAIICLITGIIYFGLMYYFLAEYYKDDEFTIYTSIKLSLGYLTLTSIISLYIFL